MVTIQPSTPIYQKITSFFKNQKEFWLSSRIKLLKERRGGSVMVARHTDADLFHQWEEAENKAAKWEAKAREERELRKQEVANVKAEMRAILAEYKEETKKQIDSLKQENVELRRKVSLLEDENKRLKSKIDQNSSNSSLPPSTDQKTAKKANEYNGREKGERKPGGQKGHKGKTLSKQDAEELIRSGEVEHRIVKCGHYTDSDQYESKYQIDAEIRTLVTEYRFYPDENGKIIIPEEYRSDVAAEVPNAYKLCSKYSAWRKDRRFRADNNHVGTRRKDFQDTRSRR